MSDYTDGNIAALFGQPFDPNVHEPAKEYEVLPPGKYTCLIEDAELKDTKAGTGKLVKLTLSVIEGQFKGRKLFPNINIFNPSEECQRMGIAQLSSLGRAAVCYPVNDTADLKDKVIIAVVKVKKRKDTGEDQNEVRTYESPSAGNVQHIPATPGRCEAPAPAPQPAPVPSNPPAAAAVAVGLQQTPGTPGNAPWKR